MSERHIKNTQAFAEGIKLKILGDVKELSEDNQPSLPFKMIPLFITD
jgi:hypothetical protein